MGCGDDAFNGLTGGDFIDMYSDAQAQFCSRNVDTIAQVLEGSHPQGQNILETSMAELVFVIGQKSSARRNLFFRQLIDATPDPWKPVAVIGVVFGICLVIGAAVYFLLGRRALARALTAEENTVALIRPTDVLQECVDHWSLRWDSRIELLSQPGPGLGGYWKLTTPSSTFDSYFQWNVLNYLYTPLGMATSCA